MVAILSRQREAILEAVQAMYTDVASHPEKTFHFPTGREACLFVGYPEEVLEGIPSSAVESFAGVGFPFSAGVIRSGDVVLDIGSGSGTDVLIASRAVGQMGRVIGLDMTGTMLRKLEHNATASGADNVEPLEGNAEEIPLPDESVDVVTSNGVLNLVPNKPRAMAEIFRVLRPGGRVQVADIVLRNPASEECRKHPELWAECVVGATLEDVYLELFRSAGFTGVEVLRSHDYFSGSASPETRKLATSLGGHAIVMHARKSGNLRQVT
jgi:ubiquinone/menaquinone biosynthesis C-methylase UbiE